MQRNEEFDVVVIGGGPAGMMSAGRAASRGRRVLLLEKNQNLGKKLLITGGGRCNLTNNRPQIREMLSKYKGSDKFLFSAFAQFGVEEALRFFHERGVATKEEAEGRVFPASDKAESVWRALIQYMKEGGVTVRTRSEVLGITPVSSGGGFFVVLKDGSKVFSRSVVLATGGVSRPETGSTGDGFEWLRRLGHNVLENDMALVPLALKDSWVKSLAGVSLDGIKITTFLNGKKQKSYLGKILFTHIGASGPTILNMSREVGELLNGGEGEEYGPVTLHKFLPQREVILSLDLFPQLDLGALRRRVQELLVQESNKKIKNTLPFLIPSALVGSFLDLLRINKEAFNHSVRADDRRKLVAFLKSVPLSVKGLLGQDKAVVSSGGVTLKEVDFRTMESRLYPRLYLVGDVLNIDRPSGGYSLQLCWTTGFIAGDHA